MDDLIVNARSLAVSLREIGYGVEFAETADTIDALCAEVERSRPRYDQDQINDRLRERAEAAEAEVARLRGMLHPYVTRVQLFDRAEKAEAEMRRWQDIANDHAQNYGKAEAQRDVWRQKADRLAEAMRTHMGAYLECDRDDDGLRPVLNAHDARIRREGVTQGRAAPNAPTIDA